MLRYFFKNNENVSNVAQEWSENELDSILRVYNLNADDAGNIPIEDIAHYPSSPSTSTNKQPIKQKKTTFLKAFGAALPFKPINISSKKKIEVKPYGGQIINAPKNLIFNEFGDISNVTLFKVKKKDKFNRDKSRIIVVDIPLQVLRIKDTKHRTHKEHIVSSIVEHTVVGDTNVSQQMIVKYISCMRNIFIFFVHFLLFSFHVLFHVLFHFSHFSFHFLFHFSFIFR